MEKKNSEGQKICPGHEVIINDVYKEMEWPATFLFGFTRKP